MWNLPLPRIVPPVATLANVVEAFLDWDVPDRKLVDSYTAHMLPCSSPQLSVHYRASAHSRRKLDADLHPQGVCGIQTEVVSSPLGSGPIGLVCARLKPEAAARVMGVAVGELTGTHVGMCDLFGPGPVSLLEEQLAAAGGCLERVQRLEEFLLARLRVDPLSPAMSFAARALGADPTLSARELAARLQISERHLSRSFRALFGTSPKQFARVVRVSKILRARWAGAAWTDIAHTLGFFDQAHMINDFRAMVGWTPSQFFCDARGRTATLNALLGRSSFCNVLVTHDSSGAPNSRQKSRLLPAQTELLSAKAPEATFANKVGWGRLAAVDCRHGAEDR